MLMSYPVIALPPLLAGAVQEITAEVAVMLPMVTLCGTPGAVAVAPLTVRAQHKGRTQLAKCAILPNVQGDHTHRQSRSSPRRRSPRQTC
jgi:hypothetical protein